MLNNFQIHPSHMHIFDLELFFIKLWFQVFITIIFCLSSPNHKMVSTWTSPLIDGPNFVNSLKYCYHINPILIERTSYNDVINTSLFLDFRRWFAIQNNQLVYKKRSGSHNSISIMEEDLRLCTVKPAYDTERRFCFEVLSPSR